MLRKITLLAMMLVFAFGVAAIAGCGDDEEPAGGGTTTEETTDSGGSAGGGSTEEDSGGGTDVTDNPQVQAAIEQCKTAIDQQPSLKDDTKDELKDLCDKAASGDIKDVQAATVEVCEKIVEDTVPDSAGAAKDQALEQCKAAAP
jgi:hypothetical protein